MPRQESDPPGHAMLLGVAGRHLERGRADINGKHVDRRPLDSKGHRNAAAAGANVSDQKTTRRRVWNQIERRIHQVFSFRPGDEGRRGNAKSQAMEFNPTGEIGKRFTGSQPGKASGKASGLRRSDGSFRPGKQLGAGQPADVGQPELGVKGWSGTAGRFKLLDSRAK